MYALVIHLTHTTIVVMVTQQEIAQVMIYLPYKTTQQVLFFDQIRYDERAFLGIC